MDAEIFLAELQKGDIQIGPAPAEISPARIELDFPPSGGIVVKVATRNGNFATWKPNLLLYEVLTGLQHLRIQSKAPGHAEFTIQGEYAPFFGDVLT